MSTATPHEHTRHGLVVLYSSDRALVGRRIEMPAAEAITVGRRGDNDLVLDAEGVSRRHARFELRDSRWWVVDLASTNGVLLNDDATERAPLSCRDRVTVGDTVFELRCEDAPYFDDRHIFERSTVDGLTGLMPRWLLGGRLEAEARRAVAENAPLAVALFDLDHFKRVNDVHGHLAGDAVLRGFASVAWSLARPGDVLGRYAGDELVWLMPATGLDEAAALAEGLRNAVRARAFAFEGASIALTVSAGVAALGADGPLDALAAADERVERAKREGRDRVVV